MESTVRVRTHTNERVQCFRARDLLLFIYFVHFHREIVCVGVKAEQTRGLEEVL